mgnify:CR=1 FL=1
MKVILICLICFVTLVTPIRWKFKSSLTEKHWTPIQRRQVLNPRALRFIVFENRLKKSHFVWFCDHFVTTFDKFVITLWPFCDHYLTTLSQFCDDFVTILWLLHDHCDHLMITLWPHCCHFGTIFGTTYRIVTTLRPNCDHFVTTLLTLLGSLLESKCVKLSILARKFNYETFIGNFQTL